MNWQRYKSQGSPIYEMTRYGGEGHPMVLELRKIFRVIHHTDQFPDITNRTVRYQNVWWPLHDVKALKTRYKTASGDFIKLMIDGRPFSRSDEQLPFIRTWDEPGYSYQVFGY